jgi:hypothetical protein
MISVPVQGTFVACPARTDGQSWWVWQGGCTTEDNLRKGGTESGSPRTGEHDVKRQG